MDSWSDTEFKRENTLVIKTIETLKYEDYRFLMILTKRRALQLLQSNQWKLNQIIIMIFQLETAFYLIFMIHDKYFYSC